MASRVAAKVMGLVLLLGTLVAGSASAGTTYNALQTGQVPEPALLSLMGGGLILAAWRIRRRKPAAEALGR